ncbi:MAG: shikimate kinase [Myxococcales bacterium]|nr:shikimate kinase [Myxococcales bacterium]
MQRPLFLTGMMGCGKTTVGRILAETLGVPLVDLDARIERLFGQTIPELFERGEPCFREHERQALASLLAEPGFGGRGVVVATGGGAVLDPDSRAAMDRVGLRVYLEVGVDELVRRLSADDASDRDEEGAARPLLEGRARLRGRVAELSAARRACYRSAAVCVDAQGDPREVAARVALALGEGARDSEAV